MVGLRAGDCRILSRHPRVEVSQSVLTLIDEATVLCVPVGCHTLIKRSSQAGCGDLCEFHAGSPSLLEDLLADSSA